MKRFTLLGWIFLIILAAAGVVIVTGIIAHSAEPIHYSPWLSFTDDADRERQIDSVGAVEVYTFYCFEGTSDSGWVHTGYRRIAFVEIREWPMTEHKPGTWTEWEDMCTQQNHHYFIPGTFRVAWKESRR